KAIRSLRDYFADAGKRQSVLDIDQQLRDFGMHWESPRRQSGELPLGGQTWELTVSLEEFSRGVAKENLEGRVRNVVCSVSSKTHCVVAGPGAGSKLARAEQLGIPVLDEAGLLQLLADHGITP